MALTSKGSGQNYLLGKTPDILNISFPIYALSIVSVTNIKGNMKNKKMSENIRGSKKALGRLNGSIGEFLQQPYKRSW